MILVISSTMITFVATIGNESLVHPQLMKLAKRLVSWCTHEICNVYDKHIYIYNQPSEDFAKEDLKLVVVLMCAWCTKHA